jgi:hypothetical protein
MGCLLAMFAGLFPRLGVFIIWVARPVLVDAAFNTFILPLLGIIFLPFATLIYLLLNTPGVGLSGWDWFWVERTVPLVKEGTSIFLGMVGPTAGRYLIDITSRAPAKQFVRRELFGTTAALTVIV